MGMYKYLFMKLLIEKKPDYFSKSKWVISSKMKKTSVQMVTNRKY